jgi:hypothetical protein
LANQTAFLSHTYYFAYLEGVFDTSMEPGKEEKTAGLKWKWADLTSQMMDLEARVARLEADVKIEQVRSSWHA